MKLGVIMGGHGGFISELLNDWQSHYKTEVFFFNEMKLPISQDRINRWWLRQSLKGFLSQSDVIFFEWATHHLITASQLMVRTPKVVRLHSWELYEFTPHIQWDYVDRVIFVSQAMRQKFVNLYPQQAEKTRVVYCGKPLDKFALSTSRAAGTIGMLCELTPIKRVYDMILTLYELKKQGHHFTLHIGGNPKDGSNNARYFVSMKRAIEKLSLQEQVVFHGWVDDPASWLQQIEIFISNSYWEGQQNALLEAMATGCYCLSHFWDGAEEVLPQEYLFVSDTELQQKIIKYCTLPNEEKYRHQQRLSSIAREKFDVERMKSEIREIINEVARESGVLK